MNMNESAKYYIRFGEIPKDEKSKIYKSDAIIGMEKGVSVWDSVSANNLYLPIMPQNPSDSCIHDYMMYIWGNKRVFLVTGIELKDKGSVGEPLLTNIHIVKELTDTYQYFKSMFGTEE